MVFFWNVILSSNRYIIKTIKNGTINEKRLVFYIYNYILYDIICFCLIFKVVYPFYRRVQVYMDIYFKSRITLLILMEFYCVFQYIKQDTVYFIDISTILGFGDRKVPARTLLRIKQHIYIVVGNLQVPNLNKMKIYIILIILKKINKILS